MKTRTLNALAAATVAVGLIGNAACENTGWALAGNILGYVLIVGILFAAVDNHLKERDEQ